MFLHFHCLDLNTRHNHSTSLRFCFQGCLQRHLDFGTHIEGAGDGEAVLSAELEANALVDVEEANSCAAGGGKPVVAKYLVGVEFFVEQGQFFLGYATAVIRHANDQPVGSGVYVQANAAIGGDELQTVEDGVFHERLYGEGGQLAI